MSKRIVVGGLTGIALVLLVFGAMQPVSAAWTKIAPIHVNNTGGNAQAYYPVRLLVPYDSDMNSNFSDLRVVVNETYNFIPYWIENKSDGEWCALWFNATYIPANSWCNDTYYLLYGNASASDASDGSAVFEFFDDMSGVLQDIDYISDGSDRATAYEMSNKIVRYGNKTHIGYLKYEGGSHKAYVRTYHHDTGEWDDEVFLGSVYDNHGGPALAVDSNGYLYVFYDGHHTTLKWRKSTNPNDASSWTDAEAVPNQAIDPTYPSVVVDSSNNIHLIYRGDQTTDCKLYYQKYNGSSWSAATTLAEDSSSLTPEYSCSIAIDSNDVLHVGVHFFDNSANKGKKAGYMKSDDGGSTWKKSDGTTYTLPITYSTLETVETGDDLRLGNIAVDSDGHPFFVVHRLHNSPKDGQFWRYNGTSWVGTTLSISGKDLYPSSTTFLNGIIYVFLHVGSSWNANDCEVYMFYSSDNGSTFTSKQISTTDSSNANWLSNAEQKNGANTLSEMRVMWTHGSSIPTEIYFAKINEDYDAELYSFGLDYVSRYTWDTTYWSDYTDDYISAPKSKHGQTTDSENEPAEVTGVNLSEKKNMPTSGVIEVNLKDLGGSNEWISIDSSNGKIICAGNHYTDRGFYRGDWANWAGYDDICVLFDGNWHKFIVRYTPTSTQIQVDDRDPVDLPTTTEVGYPTMFGLTDTSTSVANNYIVDNLFVRKYTDPEPTAQLGTEQNISFEGCTAPTITNLTNSTPTTNSVTITWTTNQSADNRVKYSKNSDLSDPLWSSWANDTTSISITLTGLEANTTYYYQAWSYNGTNSSCFTVEPSSQPYRSFTTQSSGGQYTITLAKGYNMIGWTSTTPKTSSELCNIVPNCSYVYKKNPDSSWTMKQCGYPGGDFSVSRGFGFLAYITQECDWTRDE